MALLEELICGYMSEEGPTATNLPALEGCTWTALHCAALCCISKATVFENLWVVLLCIAEAVPIVFKMDRDSCKSLSANVFSHAIGAVEASW